MKKNYVSPLATEVNIDVENIMMTMSVSDTTVDTAEEGAQLGGGRRGTWGDVWK